MFVFKAAVVGAGTMGGQIAQTIAAAGIPVVLKDIDDALVQAGLDEAAQRDQRRRSANSPRRARSPPSRPRRRSRRSSGASTARPPTRASATSTSSSRRCPSGWRSSRAVFAELDAATPGHAILASNTSSLSITEIGEATLRPGQGRRLPLLLPGLDHAADRDRRGRGDLRGDGHRGRHVRAGDPQAADHLRRGARLRRQPHPQLGHRRGLARAGGEGPVDQEDRRGRRRRRRGPGRPLLPVNLLGLDTVLHVAEHLVESYGEERFYVPKGMQKLVADGKLGAKTGGDGFYDPAGRAEHPRRRPSPTSTSSSSCCR